MVAIDDMHLQRLDLIKIDIKGMEIEALNGAKHTITRTKPQIIVEKIKSDEAALCQFLSQLGYKMFPFGINLVAVHHTDPVSELIQVE